MDSVLIVLAILLFMGIVVTILLRRERRIWQQGSSPPDHWLTAEGKVCVSRVREVISGEGTSCYAPDVQCVYVVNGVAYTTTPSCSRSWIGLSRADAEATVSEYPEGMTVTVRYDSQNPHRAVAEDKRVMSPLWRRVWQFQLDGRRHTVELEHGILSGQLIIRLDGGLLKHGNMLFRTAGEYPFHIGGHTCIVRIRSGIINYQYELMVNGQSVKASHNSNGYY